MMWVDRGVATAVLLGAAAGGILGAALLLFGLAGIEKKIRDGRAEIDSSIAAGRATAFTTVPTSVRDGIRTEVDGALARAHLTATDVRALTNTMRSLGIR